MNLRHLIYKLIKQSAFSYDDLTHYINQGREIKTSAQTITNKFNPNSDSHLPNIFEYEQALELMNGWQALADYAASKFNAVVVALPGETVIGDMSLLDSFLNAGVKSGIFDYEFKRAWEDGRIDPAEFARLKQHNLDLIGARLALIAQLELVVK